MPSRGRGRGRLAGNNHRRPARWTGQAAVFWTPARPAAYDHLHARRYVAVSGSDARNCTMFAVIGNVIVGVLALMLFTATVRLSR